MRLMFCAVLALAATMPALASDAPDAAITARIIDTGIHHGEVMETVQYLTDRIGGRMTNSPQMRAAESWTQGRFKAWGLTNVHLEAFDFGRGWSIDKATVRMTAPRVLPLRVIPVAWTPGTPGTVTAPIIVAPMRRDRDFDEWRGKLRGRIVLVSQPGMSGEPKEPAFQRLSSEEIAKLDSFDLPKENAEAAEKDYRSSGFAKRLDAFLKAEGALVWVSRSYRDGGLVSGEGYGYHMNDKRAVPGVQMAAEDYRRLARLAKGDAPVTIEVDTQVSFHEADTRANNVIADIAGSNPKAGYVMAGAHLDSWVAADGAADNGAGSAVVMEAARIIASLGVKPKRTIRFALWAGEEQALLGSQAYIEKHLATRPPADPAKAALSDSAEYYLWSRQWPLTLRPGHADLKAYFNLDNGSGKIRGIYTEGNTGVEGIFSSWLSPFNAMGASAVVASKTQGTDHVFMQAVGIPAYQFIQDPLDYDSRVHHSDIDTYDHLRADDLRQAAVIMASFLWNAANTDTPLPRGPVPTKPRETDPFAYTPKDD